jgi:YD repeat-containing protein
LKQTKTTIKVDIMLKFSVILLLLLLLVQSVVAQPLLSTPNEQLTHHVDLLNELSVNRRISTFHPNEQSIFNGLRVGYVNASKGNATFVRRDMVNVGRMPIVLARIYDSALDNGGDFGVGWQLSIAQTIEVKPDGSLWYQDDAATLRQFISSTSGFKLTPAQNSDIKSLVFDTQGLLQLTYLNGWQKQFKKLGKVYRLVSVVDNNQNVLSLHYSENKLYKITNGNNRWVMIERDHNKRIVRVIDNNNRVVSYHYNNKGRLTGVDDFLETSPGSGRLNGSHPLNHPFRAYNSKKDRRDTPYD